jgi:phosphate transport system substrate-binding protein
LKDLHSGRATTVQLEGQKPESGLSFPVGIEGIAVYVHKDNPVSELTLDQLKAIFLGDITNWKQLGGPDKKIVLYAGESSTDILPYFRESVLHDAEPYPFTGVASSKQLVETIAAASDVIGYSSVYPTTAVKAVRIKSTESAPAIEPTIESIRTRRYPLSRYVYWNLSAKPNGKLKDFCEWVLSREGQLVVESVGFEPLTPQDRLSGLAKMNRMK